MSNRKMKRMKIIWKSDQFIVVWGRESRLHGEGTDSYIGLQQTQLPDRVGLDNR